MKDLFLTPTWASPDTAPCCYLGPCCSFQRAELSVAPPLLLCRAEGCCEASPHSLFSSGLNKASEQTKLCTCLFIVNKFGIVACPCNYPPSWEKVLLILWFPLGLFSSSLGKTNCVPGWKMEAATSQLKARTFFLIVNALISFNGWPLEGYCITFLLVFWQVFYLTKPINMYICSMYFS